MPHVRALTGSTCAVMALCGSCLLSHGRNKRTPMSKQPLYLSTSPTLGATLKPGCAQKHIFRIYARRSHKNTAIGVHPGWVPAYTLKPQKGLVQAEDAISIFCHVLCVPFCGTPSRLRTTSRHGRIRMKQSTSQVLRWCLAISIFTIMAVVGSLMTMALRQLRLPRIRPGLSVWMISSARWQQATPAM